MIGDIENKIIERITAAQAALGYQLRKIDTYGGEFAEGIDRIVRDFPCVLVVFNGMTLLRQARNSYKHTARYMLIVGATNLRNEKTARHGAGGKVGSYQIAEDMVLLFAGQDLALGYMGEIVPTGIRPLINDRADGQLASVYAVDLEMLVDIDAMPDTSTIDDFETFHGNWDIPPHGNVTPPLPADETADATDTVTLPTS